MQTVIFDGIPESEYLIHLNENVYYITIQIFDSWVEVPEGEEQRMANVNYNHFAVKKSSVISGLFDLEDVKSEPAKYLWYNSFDDPEIIHMTQLVQNYIDSTVQKDRDYDDAISCAIYGIASTSEVDPKLKPFVEKFKAEAEKCATWKAQVWAKCYLILDEVNFNKRPIPTDEELIAELPKITW